MNLYDAHDQWCNRPNDERFWTLEESLAASSKIRFSAREATLPLNQLTARGSEEKGIEIIGPSGTQLIPSHYAFEQLANRANCPVGYLRSLPAPLAAENLNYGLKRHGERQANLLLHQNGHLTLRAVLSNQYGRIWNADILKRLIDLQEDGWRLPPARPARNDPRARPATEADVIQAGKHGLSVKVGDLIAPAANYQSSHDMFVFMINEDKRISDGSEHGLSRGFFCYNSEVGKGAWKLVRFFYESVCGNHIVWGASNILEIRVIHRGEAEQRFDRTMIAEVRKYADNSASEDEKVIEHAQRFVLGNNREKVIDLVFGKKFLSRKDAETAYDYAVEQVETTSRGDPTTAWGYADGITRYARTLPYADDRDRLDRAAGKILQMTL